MKKVLAPYVPENSVETIIDWLLGHKVQLKISSSRSTKLGDYRPAGTARIPRISVNHNLNKYAFLFTLVHEMAHHMVMKEAETKHTFISFRRKKRPRPHGPEWQLQYKILMNPFLDLFVLPGDVIEIIKQSLESPKASTVADQKLVRVLKKYDIPDGSEFIEKLPFDAVFQLGNGRSFRKKEKLRKRYRCISLDDGRIYLFNPMAQVYQAGK